MNSNYQIEEDEIDLRELFKTIKKNIATVIYIVIFSIILTVTYLYFSKSIYSSSTIISLDSKDGGGLGIGAMLSQATGFGGFGVGGSSSDIEKAKIILVSKKFLKTTLNDLNISREFFIEKNFRKVEVKNISNFKIDLEIKEKDINGKYFKITPIDNINYLLEIDEIDYNKKHRFGERVENTYFNFELNITDGQDPYDINITRGNIFTKLVDKSVDLSPKRYFIKGLSENSQIEKLIDNITIEDKKSNILELKYQDTLPERAQKTITTITKAFIDFELEEKMKEFNRNLKILDGHIADRSLKMSREIKEIEKFQEKNSLSIISNGSDIISDIYSKRKRLDRLAIQIEEVRNFIKNLNNGVVLSVALTSVGIDTLSIQKLMDDFISVNNAIRELELQQINIDKSITSNGQIVSFIEELKRKKSLLDVLLADFTEEHPQVVKQRREIENLIDKININIAINLKKLKKQRAVIKSTILKNISTVEGGLHREVKILKKDIEKKEKLIYTLPANRTLSKRLSNKYGFDANIYNTLLTKRIDIEIDKSSLIANTKILEDAYVAEKRDKPKVGLILVVSIITSFILGIFFIFFREFLRGSDTKE